MFDSSRRSKHPASHSHPAQSQIQSFDHSVVAQILRLQGMIGNSAVQRWMIARQAETAELLSAQQVHKAIAYYAKRPQRYTPEINQQIQAEVGTEPTGRMTEIDVQAVARRQQTMNDAGEKPELKVDGIAGPRTLPSIFKFGLYESDSLSEYGTYARTLLKERNEKSDEEIALALVEQLNKQLNEREIPPVKPLISTEVLGAGLDYTTWELILNPRIFKDDDMRHATAAIYHEGRHAEQRYRVARMLAGYGHTAEQIHEQNGIQLDVAELACEHPLRPGTMEAVIARHWYDSIYSDEAIKFNERNDAETKAAFAAREAARQANRENPTPQNQAREDAAEARYQRAVAEQDNVPHEFDSERVEDKIIKLLDEGQPNH